MMRDRNASKAYWDEWVSYQTASIDKRKSLDSTPGGDPTYRPQYIYGIANKYRELMISCYSRGDTTSTLKNYFSPMLDAWEQSEILGKDVWTAEVKRTRNSWKLNLDHYVNCFWLTGLAITLEIPESQWARLLKLMDNFGEDSLLDKIIASREANRSIGSDLCFPTAYASLLAVTDAPKEQQPILLRDYLDCWFANLKNAGSPSFPIDHRTPYWWQFSADLDLGIKSGFYMGCWCIEAVAVAKAFNIDDSLCLDHPNYPGDLLRDGRSPRHPDAVSPFEPTAVAKGGMAEWIKKILRRGNKKK